MAPMVKSSHFNPTLWVTSDLHSLWSVAVSVTDVLHLQSHVRAPIQTQVCYGDMS